MTELHEKLEELGLEAYYDAFVAEGFDTWETLLDVAESDLTTLNVKLGHRRKLQRAIADWRASSGEEPLPINEHKDVQEYDGGVGAEDLSASQVDSLGAAGQGLRRKRPYKRHPKTDVNAPRRPSSAYVIFSNQQRAELKGQITDFSEIAKIVGERWQVLPLEEKEVYDKQAAAEKDLFYQELAAYKKTPQYEEYQAYLSDFKKKHAAPQGGGGKRHKAESEPTPSKSNPPRTSASSHSTLSTNSFGHFNPVSGHRGDSLPSPEQYMTSAAASPLAGRHYSRIGSPQLPDAYATSLTSPRSVSSFQETQHGGPSHLHADMRDRRHESAPTHLTPTSLGLQRTSPAAVSAPLLQHTYERSGKRRADYAMTEPALLRHDSSVPPVPALVHTDTTASSNSETRSPRVSYMAAPHVPAHLPTIDAPKPLRILPQPVPTGLPGASEHALAALPTRLAPLTANRQTDKRQGLTALVLAADLASLEEPHSGVKPRPL